MRTRIRRLRSENMKVAVLPNLDKRGSAEVVEKLGVILKNEGIEG